LHCCKEMPKQKQTITVDKREVTVSNPDKILFPDGAVTKVQVVQYYLTVSNWLLPHLRDRPVTLKRYPDGALGKFFYEKNAPKFTPDWVETFPVSRREASGNIEYILINDRATMAWVANLASLELHPFLHRAPKIDRPDSIVFDLDPGKGADVVTCARVAFLLRDLLGKFDLQSFAKVSGSKGLQIYVPLNTAVTYAATQPFARAIADLMAEQQPELIVSQMAKALRKNRVFIDWSQNSDFKTTVSVYSLRAKEANPFVSMPVTWEELENAVERNDSAALYFGMDAAIARLEKQGDLFRPVLTSKQKLPLKFLKHVAGKTPKSLTTYQRKRDFGRTAEPAPAPVRRRRQVKSPRFVIQKHAASHLHYDFRLEMDDVLKSWAVPKGPPYAKGEKRLAMPTEDHPLDYLEFEGTIPKGQYGGGTVMVWDIGTYELIAGDYDKGLLHIRLDGRKLKGEWKLLRWRKEGERDKWLIAKAEGNLRALSKKRDDSSAISGRTMQQIAEAGDVAWKSNRGSDAA
jgi:bifunctional non-homologous end joining protein LigD